MPGPAGVSAIRGLQKSLARIAALRKLIPAEGSNGSSGRLATLEDFGSNPGALLAHIHVPDGLAAGAPLVVVLHGCTQTAGGYDHGAGWSRLADELGFAVLFPEQQRSNNPNLCFNWFSPKDAYRGRGEAQSIAQMVAAVHAAHRTDAARTFVTGLSAGGAMTTVMLAAYPEMFAGGAVIAGLPFGVAHNVPEALERMRGQGGPPSEELPALVRAASRHGGAWPTLSVWHGTGDSTVHHSNAAFLIEQWRGLHQSDRASSVEDKVDGYPHRVWTNPAGHAVIEEYRITGMAHGTPLATRAANSVENTGPHMLEAGISSTRLIARFWGLGTAATATTAASAAASTTPQPQPSAVVQLHPEARRDAPSAAKPQLEREPTPEPEAEPAPAHDPSGITRTIENALRAAGLMR